MARGIGSDLQTLAATLADAYPNATQSLQLQATDAAESLQRVATVREVPIPDVPIDLDVPPEGPERWLGRSVARSILIKRLDHAAGASVRATLDSYAAVLRRWGLDMLRDIRTQWAAASDSLRAEIDRQLGHTQVHAIDDEQVRRYLGRLTPSAMRP